MKAMNVYFEDKEIRLLEDTKKEVKSKNWHDLILYLAIEHNNNRK